MVSYGTRCLYYIVYIYYLIFVRIRYSKIPYKILVKFTITIAYSDKNFGCKLKSESLISLA
jgi:hypothetical protein